MMAVGVSTDPTFNAGRPHLLFQGPYWSYTALNNYDVSPDGQTFLMVKESETIRDTTQINVIVNWIEELRQSTSVH